MIFVNREKELEAIKKRLESKSLELIIVYGRRRIGKTSLILKAIEGYPSVYYLAVEGKNNLLKFKQTAERLFPEIKHVKEDWESLFYALKDKVIVIDEFPYLIEEDNSIPSIFQRIVDEVLKGTNTKIILVGSSISMMSDLLSYKSPLYGRRTSAINLKELKFKDLRKFNFDVVEGIRVYGFAGGVPYYLIKVKTPFLEWINEELKRIDSFLKDEMDFSLRYEFSEISTYKEILLSIAMGKNTLGEIRDFVKVGGEISSYIKKLERIGLVKREVPILERRTSKRGRYIIVDNFTNFWFKFIYPNLSEIEEGRYEIREEEYNEYLGRVFEDIAREYVKDKYGLRDVGRHWYKDVEIDIMDKGLNIAGECKWSDEVDGIRILHELESKLERLNLNVKKIVIFAKSFRRMENSEKVEYVDLKKLREWYEQEE
ncbi:ATPase [Sulfolobus sp. A20]|uniref:ATP-binding protein n=1 Tax=Sulfolobaceae TaxID=118883 RepID=UPI000845C5E6|nr:MULTISPECIES: ATP-binding protein [unclassified Sulfolobus]TRM75823.1 ATP-binding protein [Sulfolobus sp. E5]TRM77418.1 ATP-binding protein [Sulfolobus sp. A20-N-F8]TRM84093.1 ATP-binding protein [Sulfolobus sp. A20-N-F6]TRM85300.1 ATP-binding protein [Sulfolobus sp. F3]TRM86607.1 ATP-binding protein [Sulfolobus sp. C3]TRM92776.1 ATP-binding protein [Sulfolobus sp. A20-N-G8]TRN03995.1 ATP-binding protein [Sulfolobus sp. F1]